MALNTSGSDRVPDSRSVQLRRLQDELKNLKAKYSDSHPDVVKKRKELDAFLNTPSAPGFQDENGSEPSDLASPTLLAQISGLERELERLDADEIRIRKDIATYTRRIENTPRVAQALDSMNQGYEVIPVSYTHLTLPTTPYV